MSVSTCRNRPIACVDCGYKLLSTRSWMSVGLPTCCCGGAFEPVKDADRAFIGLVGADDMSQAAWNVICRELGWPIVLNQGQAKQRINRGQALEDVLIDVKPQCAYPGCGRWIATGADRCAAGHAQSEDVAPVEAMPF